MPPVPSSPDLTRWWLVPEGQSQPLGPMEIGAVLGLMRQGRASPTCLACPVGGQEWKPLQAWPAFAPHLAAPPPEPVPTASGRTSARRLDSLRRRGSRRGNLGLAFKLMLLGLSLGGLTAGGLFLWWWLGGSGDLPREASYLPDDTAFVLTTRLRETRHSPLTAHWLRNCLGKATQRPFSGQDWEQDFEQCLGVPPGYVETMLFSAGKAGDWLLILRLDRVLKTDDVQHSRQLGTKAKDLKFETDTGFRHPVFTEVRPGGDGTAAGPCFCMPSPMLVLMAPRKQLLGDALLRGRWPRLAPALRTAIAQAHFSRDLALALHLKADAAQPWKESLWNDVAPLQPPDALSEAEALALDFQRDGRQLRATVVCASPRAAQTLREKGQEWLDAQAKQAGEQKGRESLRPLFQGLVLTVRERQVLLHGSLQAAEERLQAGGTAAK